MDREAGGRGKEQERKGYRKGGNDHQGVLQVPLRDVVSVAGATSCSEVEGATPRNLPSRAQTSPVPASTPHTFRHVRTKHSFFMLSYVVGCFN